ARGEPEVEPRTRRLRGVRPHEDAGGADVRDVREEVVVLVAVVDLEVDEDPLPAPTLGAVRIGSPGHLTLLRSLARHRVPSPTWGRHSPGPDRDATLAGAGRRDRGSTPRVNRRAGCRAGP